MSSYGLIVVADVSEQEAGGVLAERVLATLRQDWPGRRSPVDDGAYAVDETADGVRVGVNVQSVVANEREPEFFADAPAGRAVVCEDGDEFGVLFQVWRLDPAGSECVYRAYVQDPELDREPRAAARAITGSAAAAAAAAALYGVDPQRLLDLEADPSPVTDELGMIGSPFMPWLSHLGIAWPEPW